MSVSVEKLENSMAVLTIEVGAKEFEEAVNKVYQRQKNRLSAPGFRKGKTPRKLIEKMYGEGIFWEDAANDLINQTYPEEAEACGEEIVSQPEIDVKQIGSGQSFIYTAKVALKPPVVLGQYKGIEVTKAAIEVSEEEIDAEIKKEQDKNASFVEVADRAGISIQQYQKFERGARNIMTSSFTTACKVIEALELDITRFYHDEYVIGEEIYLIGNKLYYKKTDKPIDEDVLETDDENTETGSTEAGSTEAGEPGITEE